MRAHSYGNYISRNRDEFELAAVADIVPHKLNGYADEFHVPATARWRQRIAARDQIIGLADKLVALATH